MEVPVTVSNNKFRGRGKSISGMVDRTLNLYQETSTTQNSETKKHFISTILGRHTKVKTHICDHCNFTSAYRQQLRNHYRDSHPEVQKLPCTHCGKQFICRRV